MGEQGIRKNWRQFSLLVVINAFVGGMIGLERSILPELAESEFNIAAPVALLSFILVFGISKAVTNYFAGAWANRIGRKRLLVIGWLFALPVPFILIHADNWNWIVAANVLLGINQGLAWSMAVVMKIDLAGEKNRGLAMGLNESAGYLAVAVVAFFTGWIGVEYGLRPYPFYLGIGFATLGLLLSWIWLRDTHPHVQSETRVSKVPKLKRVFLETSLTHRNLSSITQAGLVNNLNDAMVWGIFPILLATKGFDLEQIALVVAIYPAVWGLGQLLTGRLADSLNKKRMLFVGMLIQAAALLILPWAESMAQYLLLSFLLGIGTATVYPTFLAAIADFTHPEQRAEAIGVFRLWRDLGYAIGALLTGIIAGAFGFSAAILAVGLLTLVSAFIIFFRMRIASTLATSPATAGAT